MSPEDQKLWEAEEMAKPIDLEGFKVKIDPSPFQLVEKTSLLKVHSLFSMIGINHAYVTKIGRLVGVVALKEVRMDDRFEFNLVLISIFCFILQLRKAIEDVNSGNLASSQASNTTTTEKPPLEPQEEPLIKKESEKTNQDTVTSMDSALSTSDNCSDVELGNPVEHKTESEPKPNV